MSKARSPLQAGAGAGAGVAGGEGVGGRCTAARAQRKQNQSGSSWLLIVFFLLSASERDHSVLLGVWGVCTAGVGAKRGRPGGGARLRRPTTQ
jgi:hypothetical protein